MPARHRRDGPDPGDFVVSSRPVLPRRGRRACHAASRLLPRCFHKTESGCPQLASSQRWQLGAFANDVPGSRSFRRSPCVRRRAPPRRRSIEQNSSVGRPVYRRGTSSPFLLVPLDTSHPAPVAPPTGALSPSTGDLVNRRTVFTTLASLAALTIAGCAASVDVSDAVTGNGVCATSAGVLLRP
jgi:hypothetical protein